MTSAATRAAAWGSVGQAAAAPAPAPYTPPIPAALWHTRDFDAAGSLYQDSAETTPATADAAPIGAAVDAVAAKDAVQATAGSRPTLKLAIANGHSVLRGTAAKFLTATGFTGLDGLAHATLFAVFNTTDPAANQFPLVFGNAGFTVRALGFQVSGSRLYCYAGQDDNHYRSVAYSDTGLHVFEVVYDGTQAFGSRLSVLIDGAAQTLDADTGAQATLGTGGSVHLLGRPAGDAGLVGDLAWAGVWGTTLSSGDRTTIRADLKARFGTP